MTSSSTISSIGISAKALKSLVTPQGQDNSEVDAEGGEQKRYGGQDRLEGRQHAWLIGQERDHVRCPCRGFGCTDCKKGLVTPRLAAVAASMPGNREGPVDTDDADGRNQQQHNRVVLDLKTIYYFLFGAILCDNKWSYFLHSILYRIVYMP